MLLLRCTYLFVCTANKENLTQSAPVLKPYSLTVATCGQTQA